MRPEDAGEGLMVPSQACDDALGFVPVDEYNTVFSFPTVEKEKICVTKRRRYALRDVTGSV